jgi:hypothetical protein
MTGVRVRNAVDRSVLSLPSRLTEIATGFLDGGSIASTHARGTWRTGSPGHLHQLSRKTKRHRLWARCVMPILRAGIMPMARDDLDSHAVLSIAEHMRDAGSRFRARCIGGLPPPATFAIAMAAQQMRRSRPRAAALFFELIEAVGAVAIRSPCFPLAMPVKDWISDFCPCRLKSQPAFHRMGPSLARRSSLARMPWGVRMNARRKQRATAPASWRG